MSTMGTFLRRVGRGSVEVMLRISNVDLIIDRASGAGGIGQQLVSFTANDFREIDDSDIWEFEVTLEREGGPKRMRVGVKGDDIAMVRVESALS